jgi:hypothetical protein
MRAFDLNGVEVFPRIANAVCPAAHIEEGRQIASDYFRYVEKVAEDSWLPEKMLPTPLSPTGQAPATHYLCSMFCYSNTVDGFAKAVSDAGHEWCATAEVSIDAIPADKLYVCCGIRAEFLAAAGLQVVEG